MKETFHPTPVPEYTPRFANAGGHYFDEAKKTTTVCVCASLSRFRIDVLMFGVSCRTLQCSCQDHLRVSRGESCLLGLKSWATRQGLRNKGLRNHQLLVARTAIHMVVIVTDCDESSET